MSTELKPCPFCGCDMEIVNVGRDWLRVKPIVFHDDECPIDDQEFDYSLSCTKQEVIEIWNKRHETK